ncbi:precorrin-6y C5,15-methyltransferase (decarboxylating) subunit CbiE [Vibrio sp. PP-XX7]
MNQAKALVRLTVVGVPEDGCLSLTSRAVNAVLQARVVAGHPRHRTWFPQFEGEFIEMTCGFSAWIKQVIEESEVGNVVVLASGDPLFFGIGTTLLNMIDGKALRFIPSFSAAQLAFSRLGLPWHDARFLSCHGRSLQGVVSKMQQGDLFAILTDHQYSPQVFARHLIRYRESHWTLSVCEQLGGSEERIRQFEVEQLAASEIMFDKLNVVIAQRGSPVRWGGQGQFANDNSFLKRMPDKGLITKQAVRHLILTTLRIQSADQVWDIGSGSGSVAIESGKLCWNGNVYAIECHDQCFASIEANIFGHGTDNVALIRGTAPAVLPELPDPDAVFVGGSRGQMDDILTTVWQRLKLQGRLVVSAVTMDTVVAVYQWAKAHQLTFETQVVNVSQTQPLAHYQRYQAENPIHLFSLLKSSSTECALKEKTLNTQASDIQNQPSAGVTDES